MNERASILTELRAITVRQALLLERLAGLEHVAEPAATVLNGSGRLLDAVEVADRLGLPRWRVYELGRRGELGVVRLGDRQMKFSEPALEQYLRSGGRDDG